MKIVRFVLVVLMILFAVVQYNDPDGLWWASIYGVSAATLLLANWRPEALKRPVGKLCLSVLLVAMVVGVWFYWPEDPEFWKTDVFWETESAREGMGMMIVLFVTLFALPVAFGRSKSDSDKLDAPR